MQMNKISARLDPFFEFKRRNVTHRLNSVLVLHIPPGQNSQTHSKIFEIDIFRFVSLKELGINLVNYFYKMGA